ncbi:MAG: hypothetical protein B6V02_01595 [Thermoprotei archaeon ex4572_64]|nr:MAG: hypothetical protein B6V02_01595 [Thermoprotei archaeon ex4572_64]
MRSSALKELLSLARSEVESMNIQKLPYTSYVELVQKVVSKILSEVEFADNDVLKGLEKTVRNAVCTLIQTRISKILRHLAENREVDEDKLLSEEKKILDVVKKIEFRKVIEKKIALVLFKKSFPTIYSTTLKYLGPFSRFDLDI